MTTNDAAPIWLEVGRIGRAHGLAGDVQVKLSSDRASRLDVGSELRANDSMLVVASARPHQERWIVRFEGFTRREDVDPFRGAVLEALAIDEPGTLWVHSVVGCRVESTDGTVHGTVESVLDNPAHDILVLDSGALVPVVFIVDDSDPERLIIDPPDGLFDR